ncbi:MAG: acetyl-CoA carboxylase carboxyl transferase subunit alpha [Coriobacteriaceae bacterium]|jgi:acetyl-CoA carboxylase carboxyl transferase subunit beta|nr:acetyl-CoA carboxylase carboxyl transferase subunit alpha [Coriobacteriaceae bacterium]
MAKEKKARYITLPYESTRPEWLSGVSTEELLAANGTNVGALGTAVISHRLDQIAEEFGHPSALLVPNSNNSPSTPNSPAAPSALRVAKACCDAGLTLCLPYTDDRLADKALAYAAVPVRIGEVFSEALFANSHAILNAAQDCQAQVVLLAGSPLAEDEHFLGLAKGRGMAVFRAADPAIPEMGWVRCVAPHAAAPESNWRKCPGCGLLFDEGGLAANHYACPSCGCYYRMSSLERIGDLFDDGSFDEWYGSTLRRDPLAFPGYLEKLDTLTEVTGLGEAVRCGRGRIAGIRIAVCIMDSQFLMGSMGSAVGEKITRTVEKATRKGLPLLICTASGGARMQEGLASLMQMAKISAALARHAEAGLLYISLITDPTTGGVSASFAMQGDIILAEPKALVGFAGQRVIRDTIKRELPEGFQTAEFALGHGLIDAIVERAHIRERIAHILAIHQRTTQDISQGGTLMSYATVCENLEKGHDTYNTVIFGMLPQIRRVLVSASQKVKVSTPRPLRRLRLSRQTERHRESLARLDTLLHGRLDAEGGDSLVDIDTGSTATASHVATSRRTAAASPAALSRTATAKRTGNTAAAGSKPAVPAVAQAPQASNQAWESVQLARNTDRPTARYYIDAFVDGFIELHGDRAFSDDGALVCGIGWIGTRAVTVVAQEKGSPLKERVARNFGCPQPEGYRKSLRLMRQAEKFGRPVICLVDTQGAFCGMEAEERGQANAIAESLIGMASLQVPTISVLIGEGGSGGALAIALADRVAMQRHAVYAVLSPEGFASILWKDATRAPEAAQVMKMSAQDAFAMGIVDTVLSEGEGPAHVNPEVAAACVRSYLVNALDELASRAPDDLLAARYERFRRF